MLMITVATASTGTSALTPSSGVSAAVRITPVPKPPTAAAPSPSSATIASVGASSSKLALGHRARPAAAVDGHVGQLRLGHLYGLGVLGTALGEYLDRHGDRGGADALDVDVERDHVADLHRLLEDEFLDRHRGDAAAGDAVCDGAAGDVDHRHDPTAEDVAVLVGVGRHRHDAQLGDLPFG